MTIDAHQHFWKFSPTRDTWITDEMSVLQRAFWPSELRDVLHHNKVDGCVAVQASQSEEETFFLIDQASQYNFIKGVVGWVDLCAKNVEQRLAYFSTHKIVKGFRHIVQAEPQPDFVLRDDFKNGISLLARFNFTYDILVRPMHLPFVIELVKQFPQQKFVLDHLAKPLIKEQQFENWKSDMQVLAQHQNVFCKLSGMVTEADWKNWKAQDFIPYLDVVFESFGVQRLLYGSDWPVCLVAATYEQQQALVNNYLQFYSAADRAMVQGINAINFYNL